MILTLRLTFSGTAFTGHRPPAGGHRLVEPTHAPMLPCQPQIMVPARLPGEDHDDGGGRNVERTPKKVKKTLANWIFLLVAAHMVGVVIALVCHREAFACAMCSSLKRALLTLATAPDSVLSRPCLCGPFGPALTRRVCLLPDAKLKQKTCGRQEPLRSDAQLGDIRSKETKP